MARPQKDGLDYFPHDTDAVNDEKIEALRSLYGNDGYAFYFILLERIYRTSNQEIDVSEAETIQVLARKVEVTTEKFAEMLQTALKWRCFDKKRYEEEGVLTSNGVKRRARPVLAKRAAMKDKYWEEVRGKISGGFLKQKRGVKKSKVKESKEKKSTSSTPPTPPKINYAEYVKMTEEQYGKLVEKYGQETAAELIFILDNYKGSKGKTYKDDYRAILSWVVKRHEEDQRKCPGKQTEPKAWNNLRTWLERKEVQESERQRI